MVDIILHDENGKFKKGNPGGPGRPKGLTDKRRRLSEMFVDTLMEKWEHYGEEMLAAAMMDKPSAVLAVIQRCMPNEVEVTTNIDDQLERAQARLDKLTKEVDKDDG